MKKPNIVENVIKKGNKVNVVDKLSQDMIYLYFVEDNFKLHRRYIDKKIFGIKLNIYYK